MSDFYPSDYDETLAKNTASGGYMKWKQGDNRFRILSKPIIGSVLWVTGEDGKPTPLRFRIDEPVPAEKIEKQAPKFFNTFIVFNYQTNDVEILEITQKGILTSLRKLTKDDDWGDPRAYDIVVEREGESLETSYETRPKPKTPVSSEIKDIYKEKKIDLEKLFSGEDPFGGEKAETGGKESPTEQKMDQDVDPNDIPF